MAPALLGLVLAREVDGVVRRGRIVEVEAYGAEDDPASHAHRGPTARNGTMFGPPGTAYVYFTYGMHWCVNVVSGAEGEGGAVLLRALEPVEGLDLMLAARTRPGRRPPRTRDLCRGPARLCQALGIDRALDGADLVAGDRGLRLEDDGYGPCAATSGSRIGISKAADRQWRWWVSGTTFASR